MILDSTTWHDENNNDEWIWWKHGVVYHIYTLSFFDSNNDGKGDIQGIIQQLWYFEKLGVDAILLTPVFLSSFVDFGYDITDYYAVDPKFGTIEDLKELIEKAHSLNIRIILDMVLNHTSAEHPWFIESRSNPESYKRNWYIWKSSESKGKPNNWKSVFGKSAWEFDSVAGQYYLHSFLKEQPDLNWRNRELKHEMMNVLCFWLETGIDGFRFDSINFIIKDKKLRNDPVLRGLRKKDKLNSRNHPKSFEIVERIRDLLDKYPGRMGVGEIYTLPPGDSNLVSSYISSNSNPGLNLAFDFSSFFLPWNAKRYYKLIENWQSKTEEGKWPCYAFSNHDLFRSLNKHKLIIYQHEKARLHALLLFTLKGTPFIYYGEEIGMMNSSIPRNLLQDPLGKKYWPFFKGRDRCRTPMQWTNNENAGFSTASPWLPVNRNYQEVNVENQINKPDSLWWTYQKLIEIRRNNLVLQSGEWEGISNGEKKILAYIRKSNDKELLIVVNFSRNSKRFKFPFVATDTIIFSTSIKSSKQNIQGLLHLHPFEGLIIDLKPRSLLK